MNKHHLIALAVSGALLSLAAVAAEDAPPCRGKPGEHFAALDADKDGRLSRQEAQAAPRLAGRFDEVDANHDGFLVKDEMRAAGEQVRAKIRERGEQRFVEADRNGDGQLDMGETQASMPRVAERFQQLDADKNGTLSREELREGAITNLRDRRRPGPPTQPQP